MGVVNLIIDMLDEPPTAMDGREDWEAISEVSFEATGEEFRIHPLMEEAPPPFDRFRLPHGVGWFRVRSHAVGRALDFDAVVSDNPRETHLLQLWPAPGFEPARHYRVDDRRRFSGRNPDDAACVAPPMASTDTISTRTQV